MKCLHCDKRIRTSKAPATPVYYEDSLLPVGYVCDPCAPAFRAAVEAENRRIRYWPLEVVK